MIASELSKEAAARLDGVLGKGTTQDLVEAADATLVKLGRDAERRQRRRVRRRWLKKAAKAAAVVGAGAAAVLAVRQAVRKRK